ncbi:MAG: DUF3107 domain-containing protein [Nocardioides sp.]
MEVKIGVQYAPRELVVDVSSTAAEVEKALSKALGDGSLLKLSDTKGRTVMIPAERISYVEIGSTGGSQVGFRS